MSEAQSLASQVYIKLDETNASDEFMRVLIDVTVESSLHIADMATLVLHDPKVKWIDDSLVAPGRAVKIYTTESAERSDSPPVFDGEIVELEPNFGEGTHHLVIRAFDRLHRLSRGRLVRSFQNVTASDLVQKIAQEVGLQSSVEATREVYPYLLQRNQTNFEFLSERAGPLGFMLYVEGKTLCFKPLKRDGDPVELEWAAELTEFRPRLTTIGQFNSVSSRGWDVQAKKEVVSDVKKARSSRDIGEKKQGGEAAKSAFRIDAADLVYEKPMHTQSETDSVAKAAADRHEETFVQAEGVCAGDPRIVAGGSIKVTAVGHRFTGTYLVTSVAHSYSLRGYSTTFSVSGHNSTGLLAILRGAVGVEHGAGGVVIGIVTDVQDPKGWGRVKVKYPWLSGQHASDWARVAAAGGGADRGLQFLPEVDDEVVVAFEMGDMRFPYVIGGLWNGKDSPPKPNSAITSGGKVTHRLIRSRTGHSLVFDDSDGGGGITVEDKNGNKIQMDSASNKLSIEAKGDISISATGRVEIKGKMISLN